MKGKERAKMSSVKAMDVERKGGTESTWMFEQKNHNDLSQIQLRKRGGGVFLALEKEAEGKKVIDKVKNATGRLSGRGSKQKDWERVDRSVRLIGKEDRDKSLGEGTTAKSHNQQGQERTSKKKSPNSPLSNFSFSRRKAGENRKTLQETVQEAFVEAKGIESEKGRKSRGCEAKKKIRGGGESYKEWKK